jgi:hypothetical protein
MTSTLIPMDSVAQTLRAILGRAEDARRAGDRNAEHAALQTYSDGLAAGVAARPQTIPPLSAQALMTLGIIYTF